MSIGVLIVDDSALMRKLLEIRLGKEDDIDVIGTASDASEARRLIKTLNPDVVTLDIEMPGMDGLSFLQKIMELRPTPVIVVSGFTKEGAVTTARALQLGAISSYAKSDRYGGMADDDGGRLANQVREAATVSFAHAKQRTVPTLKHHPPLNGETQLIAIGSSTGGVEALHTLLSGFPSNCPPTVIVQHVNACFAPAIARSLDSACKARVVVAQTDTPLKPGTISLAPGGDRHLMVASAGSKGFRTILRTGDPVSGHQPSVDALFNSIAELHGIKVTGVLLTGMGQDGANGLLNLANGGAKTFVQDEKSCVVFGMPRKAIELGAAQNVLALDQIAPALFERHSTQPGVDA